MTNNSASKHLVGINELVLSHEKGEQEIADTINSCLKVIESQNTKTNAVVWLDKEFVDREVQRVKKLSSNSPEPLPLLGVPILVKEIDSAIAGTENCWGNNQLKELGIKDDFTATSVIKLQDAGAVIVGKSNNPELALTVTTKSKAHGPCNNPLDILRNSGGSSGGAAAAVASGMVSVATGSDGGGSIRIPASNCGVYGFKPSRNAISLGPILEEFWGGLVCKGLISSNLKDLKRVFKAVSNIESKNNDDFHLPKKLKIGIRIQGFASMYDLDSNVISAINSVADFFSNSGHDVQISSPSNYDDISIVQPFLEIIAYNTFNDVIEMQRRATSPFDIDNLEAETFYFYEKGASISNDKYRQACELIEPFTKKNNLWYEDFDILITPTTGNIAPLHGEVECDPELGPFVYSGLCFPSNITGGPSLSVPVKSGHETGLPVGIQIVAKHENDELVLALGEFLESDYSDIFVTRSQFITS